MDTAYDFARSAACKIRASVCAPRREANYAQDGAKRCFDRCVGVHAAVRAIPLVLVASLSLVAQSKDVNGWGKIKWGMTVAQAKAVYGTQVQVADPASESHETDEYVDQLVIERLKVGDLEMQVAIKTPRGSDGIREVALALPKGDSRASRISAYAGLRNSLILKYGKPSHAESKDTDIFSESTTWAFPSTIITLYHIETKDIQFGILGLQYAASDKKAVDAL